MIGAAVWLVLAAGAWGWGSLLLRCGSVAVDAWERAGFSFGLGFGILGFGIYFLGLAGWLRPWTIGLWVALPALFSLTAFRPPASSLFPAPVSAWPGYEKLVGGAAVLSLLLTFVAAGAPPVAHDALAYHLALPKIHLARGEIRFVPWLNPSEWPDLLGMLSLPGLALGVPQAAHFVHGGFGILSAAGVYRWGSLFYGRRAAVSAFALFSTLTVYKILSVTALVDLGVCFYALLSLHALLRHRESHDQVWLVLAGIAAGLAGSVKLTGLVWMAGLAVVQALAPASGGRLRAAGSAAVLAAVGGAVTAPWLMRSWWETGNPVWPFFHGVFGGVFWDGEQTRLWLSRGAEHLAAESWPRSLWEKIVGLLSWDVRKEAFAGIFIPAFLLLFGPGWKGAFPDRTRIFPWVMGIYFSAYLGLMPRSPRYLSPILTIAALGLSGAAWRLAERGGAWRKAAMAAVLLVMAWQYPPLDPRLWEKARVSVGLESPEAYLLRSVDIYPASLRINAVLGEGDRVGMLNDIRGFYLDREYAWADPVNQHYVDYGGVRTAGDLCDRWFSAGLTHVLLRGTEIAWPADGGRVLSGLLTEARPMFREGGFSLYALSSVCAEASGGN